MVTKIYSEALEKPKGHNTKQASNPRALGDEESPNFTFLEAGSATGCKALRPLFKSFIHNFTNTKRSFSFCTKPLKLCG